MYDIDAIRELPEYKASDYLDDAESVALYLAFALAEGDPELIMLAIRNVADAKGMAELAKVTGLSRTTLYRSLSENGNPRLDTLLKIFKAFGIRFSAVVDKPDAEEAA